MSIAGSLGVTNKVIIMWLGGHVFEPWKQSLEEIQGKTAYKTLVIRYFLEPRA